MNILSYWSWEGQPSVLADKNTEDALAFYIPNGEQDWVPAREYDVVQWFKEGREMPEEKFNSLFGVIGKDLPPLPPS